MKPRIRILWGSQPETQPTRKVGSPLLSVFLLHSLLNRQPNGIGLGSDMTETHELGEGLFELRG